MGGSRALGGSPAAALVARIAAKQDGVVSARQCRQAGMGWDEIVARYRSGAWRVLFRGVYDTRGAAPSLTDRARVRAALLAVGPSATAVLTSAAHLLDLPYAPSDHALQVAVPAPGNRLDQPGLQVRQLVIPAADQQLVDGMQVTTPVRTLADLLLHLSRAEAVAMLDGAWHQGRINEGELSLVLARLRRRRGAVRARRLVAAADGRAASPLETRIRLACADGGVPPEELQYPILDESGQVLAVADLAWPSRRVIVEADGRLVHGGPAALYRDRRRQNDLAALGWTVVRFTWADLGRSGYVVNAVRRALTAAVPQRSGSGD